MLDNMTTMSKKEQESKKIYEALKTILDPEKYIIEYPSNKSYVDILIRSKMPWDQGSIKPNDPIGDFMQEMVDLEHKTNGEGLFWTASRKIQKPDDAPSSALVYNPNDLGIEYHSIREFEINLDIGVLYNSISILSYKNGKYGKDPPYRENYLSKDPNYDEIVGYIYRTESNWEDPTPNLRAYNDISIGNYCRNCTCLSCTKQRAYR